MRTIGEVFRQWKLRRPLLGEERVVLNAVREKYPAHSKDVVFFLAEEKARLPVRSSALIQVWRENGDGPCVHLTNLAGFMRDGMSIDEIKNSHM